jgi:hypothetical protein
MNNYLLSMKMVTIPNHNEVIFYIIYIINKLNLYIFYSLIYVM